MNSEERSRDMEQPSGARTIDRRSLADLFRELTTETRTLVRQEINLAKTEASETISEAGQDAGLVGAGGAVAYVGFITLVIGLSLLVGTVMPAWLAFIVVGAVVSLAGYGLLQSGLTALRQTDWTLTRTVESLEDDKQWMKEEMRQIKRGENRKNNADAVHSGR